MSSLPADVTRFILASVPSIPYLEAIVLLRFDHDQPWLCAQVANRLYIPSQAAKPILEALVAAGIAARTELAGEMAFRYAPSSTELDAMLERVLEAYGGNLVAVTELIHSKVDRKAHRLANAFVWKKEP